MKIKWPRLPDSIAVTLGLVLLLAAGLAAAFAPGGEFSDWERRYLANAPQTPDILNWDTDKKTETFLADHIPLRNSLVAIDSLSQLLSGRRTQLEAWYVDGCVVEQPVAADATKLERNLQRFSAIAEKAGLPWLVLTPPTHGWLLQDQMPALMASAYEQEGAAYTLLEEYAQYVPMPETFCASPQEMYYRTDHHWTLAGAYQAYCALADRLGYEALPLESFRISEYPGFLGTTLSRSGLPHFTQDTLICAEPDSPVTLTIVEDDATFDQLIFPEAAETYDGYAVYLNGNHGMLIIQRPSAPEGTLIVYKDSFANCLLPLLSQHFRQIIAVDARYYQGTFSNALAMADDTRALLFMYSLDSLANDTNLIRKAR